MATPMQGAGLTLKTGCTCGDMRLTRFAQNERPLSAKQFDLPAQTNFTEDPTEATLEGFLEVAPDAVVVADQSGRIIRVNVQAEKLFQYHRGELIGQQIEVLMPERFRERHAQHRAAYSSNPKMRPMGAGQEQLIGLRKDGQEFPVDISLGVLPARSGFLIVSAIRNVADRRRLEAELLERTLQLEEANLNKDRFMGMLAHELRSPLAAVCMAVEVLRQSPALETPEELWDIIRRQTKQMLHLVDDLMDVSRIAHAKVRIEKTQVDLEPLISQAIEAVQPLLRIRKHQLHFSTPAQSTKLLADPVRMVEVFTNLLHNAVKYSSEGGNILVKVVEEGNEVVIDFRDHGIGITAEMLPRIFEPFTQAICAVGHSEGGIGIGLAMVSHLVRLHAGTVQAFSDGPGQGSRFVVRLPTLNPLKTEQSPEDLVDHQPFGWTLGCLRDER